MKQLRLLKEKNNVSERIERIRIPDDDMVGWIETLRNANFTQKEMDQILAHLNVNYAVRLDPAAFAEYIGRRVDNGEISYELAREIIESLRKGKDGV